MLRVITSKFQPYDFARFGKPLMLHTVEKPLHNGDWVRGPLVKHLLLLNLRPLIYLESASEASCISISVLLDDVVQSGFTPGLMRPQHFGPTYAGLV
ncbi:hypothetical protein Ancab_004159, partial [Ancistrocladus abbreviatus]